MYGGIQTWIKIELMPLRIELKPLSQNNILNVICFWIMSPCSLVGVYQRFRGILCLNIQRIEGW